MMRGEGPAIRHAPTPGTDRRLEAAPPAGPFPRAAHLRADPAGRALRILPDRSGTADGCTATRARQVARFETEGMASLFPPVPPEPRHTLPTEIRYLDYGADEGRV